MSTDSLARSARLIAAMMCVSERLDCLPWHVEVYTPRCPYSTPGPCPHSGEYSNARITLGTARELIIPGLKSPLNELQARMNNYHQSKPEGAEHLKLAEGLSAHDLYIAICTIVIRTDAPFDCPLFSWSVGRNSSEICSIVSIKGGVEEAVACGLSIEEALFLNETGSRAFTLLRNGFSLYV